ncbi:MAG: hypothetical protein BECKG1743D_GA0114223_100418 [Candidatus Kentron sp. G]|nr:MAG: hypothetical protein BECKG1743F_GA0114225_100417 [Candidatus Kentron sp. G]VFM96123.1 MAG: hypothetical protein BECKG1743E_GA0114224_100377 [Candidatus Kentron sp. G]VFM98015.1 MAG: hypothetical protein BECKG1743D_GA0114223_100418 [Candidatus Kentron sp. G]
MITQAIILGAVQAAIYREDDSWRAVRLGPSGKGIIDCTRSLALLMESRAEQRALTEPLSNLAELETHLRGWSRKHRALTLLIAGMDDQLSFDTRRTCLEAAEELLLWDTGAHGFARARLLGCPASEDADITGGYLLSEEIGARTAAGFYRELRAAEVQIPAVRRILDEILFFAPGSEFNPEAARRAIIDAGVVADAVLVLTHKAGPVSLWQLVENYSEDPSLGAEVRNPRFVLRPFMSRIHELMVRELMERKSSMDWIESRFSKDPILFEGFSASRVMLKKYKSEAMGGIMSRERSALDETNPPETSREISDLMYPYAEVEASPPSKPRFYNFHRETA